MIVNVGPGAPGAARHARGDRRRQGRADRRAGARARLRSSPPRSRCWSPTCAPTCASSLSAARARDVELAERAATTGSVVDRHAGRARSSCGRLRGGHNLRNLLAAVAAARALGVKPDGRGSTCGSRRCAASASQLAGGMVLVNDCYNANPMSMRAAIDDLAEMAGGAARGGARRHARARRRRRGVPPRDRRVRGARAGVELLVTVGPLAARDGAASSRRGRRRGRRRATVRRPSCCDALPPATRCSSRARAGVGLERVGAKRCASSAAGVAAARARPGGADGPRPHRRHRGAADLHLPEPEVHRVPAPARVRPAHPRGRARGPPQKAGTPTMGGVIIFLAVAIAVLHPHRLRLALVRGVRRRARLRAARLRRRLHQDRQATLARSARRARS